MTPEERLARIDERTSLLLDLMTRHLEEDAKRFEDLGQRLRTVEAFRSGVLMVVGFVTAAAAGVVAWLKT